MTAYHCIVPENTDTTAAQLQRYNSNTWTFLFNHQRVNCNDSISLFYGDSFYGSNRLSPSGPGYNNAPPSDYLLLEIWSANETEFARKGICYAGWDNANSGTANYYGIHHPNGDVKKISVAQNLVNFSSTHWEVDWDQGTTEGGSSGSPLFNSNHRVIGQVHYGKKPLGTSNCYPNQVTGYGKLSSSWSHGGFAHWLDPTYSNVTTMNSFCPTISGGGSGGGTGGGGTRTCIPDMSYAGFLVNGNNADDLNVCINSPIVIAMPDVDPYDASNTCYFPVVLSNKSRSLFSPGACAQLRTKDYYSYTQDLRRCHIRYKQLFISIQEVDENNAPIGPETMEWVYFDRKTDYDDPHNNGANTDKLKSFNLKEFSPQNYVLLLGKRYKLKLANSRFNLYSNGVFYPHNGWYEKVKYLDVYADEAHLDNTNINQDLTANSISLKNLTVSNSKIVAANQIEILNNTTLNSNSSYFVDSMTACLSEPSYRRKNPNNSQLDNENAPVKSYSDKISEILVYPNPTTENISLKILDNNIDEGRCEIVNYNGVVMMSARFTNKTFQLNTKGLKNGIYFVWLFSEQKILTTKFIKQ